MSQCVFLGEFPILHNSNEHTDLFNNSRRDQIYYCKLRHIFKAYFPQNNTFCNDSLAFKLSQAFAKNIFL